jgi:zinc transport system ATP-binding protein
VETGRLTLRRRGAAFYPIAFAAEQVSGGAFCPNPTVAGPSPMTSSERATSWLSGTQSVAPRQGFQLALEDALEAEGRRSTCSRAGDRRVCVRPEGGAGGAGVDPTSGSIPCASRAWDAARTALGDPSSADARRRLDELDAEHDGPNLRAGEIVTSHAAFGYLADRTTRPDRLTGLSSDSQPSLKEVESLVEAVRAGRDDGVLRTLVSFDLGDRRPRGGASTAVLDPLEGSRPSRLSTRGRFSVMRRTRGVAQGARMHVASTPAAVELDDVSFGYRGGPPALEHVTLSVAEGSFVGIAGPNGGGKTTLLRLALGLERPASGSVRLFGAAPGGRGGPRVGYLPQRAHLATGSPVTVREVVSAGRLAVRGPFGPLRHADRDAVASAISRVGLEPRADAPLRTLSGGMQQRAFIAKALAAAPALLALDEPTTGVDAASQESLAVLLEELREELGVTVLYVSHEFGAVEQVVSRLVLVRGGIVFDGLPSELPALWHDPSHDHGHPH